MGLYRQATIPVRDRKEIKMHITEEQVIEAINSLNTDYNNLPINVRLNIDGLKLITLFLLAERDKLELEREKLVGIVNSLAEGY